MRLAFVLLLMRFAAVSGAVLAVDDLFFGRMNAAMRARHHDLSV